MTSSLGRFGARSLRRAHRTTGSAFCVLFLLWFASGIVMTFHGYPEVSRAEQLARSSLLSLSRDLPPLADLPLGTASARGPARLVGIEGRFAWVVEGAHGSRLHDARSGLRMDPLDPLAPWAAELANAWREEPARLEAQSVLETPDQWTLAPRLRPHFPLVRLTFNDGLRTHVYVSTRSGEVVQRTTWPSRTWAWAGAIPHWIYPACLVRLRGLWRHVVMWLAGAGMIVCVSGLLQGIWLWRPWNPYLGRGGRASSLPYRKTLFRWHHLLGLAFGMLSFTFVTSGLLSLHPFSWSQEPRPEALVRLLEEAEHIPWARATLPPERALTACRRELTVAGLRLVGVGGQPYFLCESSSGDSLVVSAVEGDTRTARRHFAIDEVLQSRVLRAGRVSLLAAPDAYHRTRHDEPHLALPVARVTFTDPADTWSYFDLRTGQHVSSWGRRKRLERWLYNGLHSFDLPALYTRRALWQAVIVGACVGGGALAATGTWLAVRRGHRGFRRARRRAPRAGRARCES